MTPTTQPRNIRTWLAFCHDLGATALAWAAMYLVRFNLDFREPYLVDMLWTLAWILPLQGTIFVAFGLYRGLWRFASVLDLRRIALAVGLGALLIPLVLVMLGIGGAGFNGFTARSNGLADGGEITQVDFHASRSAKER